MYWVVMNGYTLPTPYLTMDDAVAAMNKLRAENGPSIFDIIHD